nr:MAG TPA: hypothetical protein [Caudoviricetes sp.]
MKNFLICTLLKNVTERTRLSVTRARFEWQGL